jgi:hypothetical protein
MEGELFAPFSGERGRRRGYGCDVKAGETDGDGGKKDARRAIK